LLSLLFNMKLKVYLSLLLSLGLYFGLNAQNQIRLLDELRVQNQKSGMLVLGSWATINILSSLSLNTRSSGSNRYFHQMNGYWNAVNLMIAAGGFWSARLVDPSFLDVLSEQDKMENILLFNAALDIGYMIGGAYLIERSKRGFSNSQRLKGYGQSIIMQGGFLFVFDLIMIHFMHQNHLRILHLTERFSLSLHNSGLSIYF
jgi:hypothetical protein